MTAQDLNILPPLKIVAPYKYYASYINMLFSDYTIH